MLSIAFDSRDIRAYNKLAANYLSDLLFKEKNDSIKRWGSDVYIGNGFVEKDLAYNRTKQPNMRTLEFNARQFRAFEEILSLLKQKKIKTILVYAPVSPKLYHSFTNNAEFDKKMKAYGEYYNFNELVEMDNVLDFYDADHMNKNGVAKFNKKLISVLDSVGALKTNY